jgi:hypothetical protein
MDDVLLTFGTLCVMFCAYAILTHHFRNDS